MKKRNLMLLLIVAALCLPAFSACTEDPATQDPADTSAQTTEADAQDPTDAETTAAETEADTTVAETTEETTAEPEKGRSMQIIPDIRFEDGISLISQKDHANGDAFSVLAEHDFYGGEPNDPVWRLSQWDSGPCLVANRIESAPTTITDGMGRSLIYNPKTNIVTIELDTYLYYQGKPAIQGDYWPHLLVEQSEFSQSWEPGDKEFLICDADRMILSMDIRMMDYQEDPVEGDWVRAAQFLMYFYIKGLETNDFCWFGVQFFDNRYDMTDNYIGYDGGKPDASGAMIYSIGSKNVYANSGRSLYKDGTPDTSGEWVHVEIDLRPYFEDMLQKGLDDGYFDAEALDELYITGMNFGWETIGTFHHTMEIRDLQLISYIDD